MKQKILRTIALRSFALVGVLTRRGKCGDRTPSHVSNHGPARPIPDGCECRDSPGTKRRPGIHLTRCRGHGPRSPGYETAVKGKNGFVCMVERSWAAGIDDPDFWNPKLRSPVCLNAPAARSYPSTSSREPSSC